MTEKTKHYPDVSAKADFPQLERDILEYWRKDDTFAKSIANRDAGAKGSNEYVFYDGPPFANGLPHYGHLLTGYVKDIVPRYQTMRGLSMDEVKRTNGKIDFEDALLSERGV